jgi:hypothetical protein
MDRKGLSTEDLTRKWEYRRELKNLMGKYMFSLMLKNEKNMFDMFWSKTKKDVCLGFNNGWYQGKEAIRGYYDAIHQSTVVKANLMQTLFPEQLGGKTKEEIYGAGPYEAKPVGNVIIAIAEDEKTSKGIWYSRGSFAEITSGGPISYWTWGCYTVDFVLEDEEWKIWHMQYLEDIRHPCGQDWSKPAVGFPELQEFTPIKSIKLPEPNIPMVLREYYYPDRPFTPLPRFPEPYETFTKTFSYGI